MVHDGAPGGGLRAVVIMTAAGNQALTSIPMLRAVPAMIRQA